MPSRKGRYLPILMEMEHPDVLFLLDTRSMELERKEMSQLLCDFFYLQSSKVTLLHQPLFAPRYEKRIGIKKRMQQLIPHAFY